MNKRHFSAVLFLISVLSMYVTPLHANQCFRVEGFYPSNWGDSLPVSQIPTDKLTHVIIAFALLDDQGNLNTTAADSVVGPIVNKAHADNTKVLISIGGATADFRGAASSEATMNNLVNNIVAYVDNNNLDGVDIDWEDWSIHGAPNPTEAAQLVDLLKKLKAALPADKELTVDVFTGGWNGQNYLEEIDDHVDFVHGMTYDYSGQWGSSPIKHHATWSDVESGLVTGAENLYGKYDVSKTIIGIPFYGKNFTNGQNTNVPLISYRNVIDNIVIPNGLDVEVGKDSGYTQGNDKVFWETPALVAQKATYAKDNGYGGVMIWELRQDTLNETYSLLNAISQVLPKDNCVNTVENGFVLPTTSGNNIQLSLGSEFLARVNQKDAVRVVFEIFEEGGNTALFSQNVTGDDTFELNIAFSGSVNPAVTYTVVAKGYDAADQALPEESINIMFIQFWPPVVDITSHDNGDKVRINTAHTIDVNLIDGNHNVTKVEFYIANQLAHTDSEAPYQFDWTPTSLGNVEVEAKAYKKYNDIDPPVSGSDTVTIEVVNSGDKPPCELTDPNAGNYNAWQSNQVYTSGMRVSLNELVWEANWWNMGSTPSANNSTWSLISDIEFPWSASAVYVGGDEVNHENRRYRANYWNQGANPASSPAWTDIGEASCQH